MSAAKRTPGPTELPKSSISTRARTCFTLLSLSLGPAFLPQSPVTLLHTSWWKCSFQEDSTVNFRGGNKEGRGMKALKTRGRKAMMQGLQLCPLKSISSSLDKPHGFSLYLMKKKKFFQTMIQSIYLKCLLYEGFSHLLEMSVTVD